MVRSTIALIIMIIFWLPALRHPSMLKRAPYEWVPLEDGGLWDPNTGDIWDEVDG